MNRVVIVVAAALLAGVALTGCGRLTHATSPEPAPTASTSSSGGQDAADALADLDAASAALDGAETDGLAGDEAARTDDAP